MAQRSVAGAAGSSAVGLLLLGGAATWWLVSGLEVDASAVAAAGLIAGAALALGISWFAAARRPVVVLTGLVGAAIAVFAADAGATLRVGPTQGPFGYANATAAFFAQACVAAVMLAALARGPLRVVGALAAAGCVPVVLLTRSWTVAVLIPLALGAAAAVDRWGGDRVAVAVCAGLFAVAVAATIVLGALDTGGEGPLGRAIDATITEERVALWNDALSITARHPMLGAGPGGFARASATAASDADLRWAHNEFLQAGAETGLLGYALAVGVFLWGFAALGQGSGRGAVLAAAGLAILGVQASVDYVLHFPFVAILGAAVLGAGIGASRAAPVTVPRVVDAT